MIKSIIKYILVNGFSKGGYYLLLLVVGFYSTSESYLQLLLFFSLEQLIYLITPLNKSVILLSNKEQNVDNIFSNLFSYSILVCLIYIFSLIIFWEYIKNYFSYDVFIIYLLIPLNSLVISFIHLLQGMFNVKEYHSKSVYIQSLLLIPFFFSGVFVLFFNDPIFGFFLGKFSGLLMVIMILKLNNSLKPPTFSLNISILNNNNIYYITVFSFIGWLSGYGFLNIVKIFGVQSESLKVGYVLNIYSILFIIGNSISKVYSPRIKKLITDGYRMRAINLRRNTIFLFVCLSISLPFCLIIIINIIDFRVFDVNLNEIILYSSILFFLTSFTWLIQPFYYVENRFKEYSNLILFSTLISFFFIGMIIKYTSFGNFTLMLILLALVKSFILFNSKKLDV